MRDGKRGGLLRKRQGKFPDQNDGGVYEKGERPVLVFAGEIATDPRVGTEQRPLAVRPASRDISKDRQDRKLVVVVPEEKRIVPEKDEAEKNDDPACV